MEEFLQHYPSTPECNYPSILDAIVKEHGSDGANQDIGQALEFSLRAVQSRTKEVVATKKMVTSLAETLRAAKSDLESKTETNQNALDDVRNLQRLNKSLNKQVQKLNQLLAADKNGDDDDSQSNDDVSGGRTFNVKLWPGYTITGQLLEFGYGRLKEICDFLDIKTKARKEEKLIDLIVEHFENHDEHCDMDHFFQEDEEEEECEE